MRAAYEKVDSERDDVETTKKRHGVGAACRVQAVEEDNGGEEGRG